MATETKITVLALEKSAMARLCYRKGVTLWQIPGDGDMQMRKPSQNSYLYRKVIIIDVNLDTHCLTIRRTFLTWLKDLINRVIDKLQDDTFHW